MRPEQLFTLSVGVPALALTVANTITAPEQMSNVFRSVTVNGHDVTQEAIASGAMVQAIIFAMLVWGAFYVMRQSAQAVFASR